MAKRKRRAFTPEFKADAVKLVQAGIPADAFSSITGRASLNLGRALQAQGKSDEARAAFRSAVENLQSTLGPEHPDTRGAMQMAESIPTSR